MMSESSYTFPLLKSLKKIRGRKYCTEERLKNGKEHPCKGHGEMFFLENNVVVVQPQSCVQLFVTQWIVACQASLSSTRVLIKRGPGNRGPPECGTPHEATSGMSS